MADELNLQAERELFEAAEKERGTDLSKAWGFGTNGEYTNPAVENRWQGWLMARRSTPASAQQGEELARPTDLSKRLRVYAEDQMGPAFIPREVALSAADEIDRLTSRSGAGAAAEDAARLEWVSHERGGQRTDYAMHVLKRGGTGDLSDIRTFIDAARAAHPGDAAEGKGASDE